ncbi:MAG TPA: N-acetyltransferase [Nitrospirae bacterium]|nr:N-acetyltransferase [Nitrospirota bacterium]
MSEVVRQSGKKERGTFPGVFRAALIKDAKNIQALVKVYADQGLMLPRSLNELYETIREYTVYEEDGKIKGACALHVAWEDLAEIMGLAIDPKYSGRGIGARLVNIALEEATRLGIPKVFTLTYVPDFFKKSGFEEVDKSEFPHKIWSSCVRCHKFPDCDETGMIIHLDF